MAKPTLFQEIELNTTNISQLESNKANDSAVVHVSGDETIAGKKSFTTPIEGNITGNATSANKLNTNAGSEIIPVYFNAGVPVATSYSIQSNVPENAVFTDTKYSVMTGATSTANGESGLVPAPIAGQQELFLRGDGTWASVGAEGFDNFLSKSGGTMEGNLITKGSFGLVSSLSGDAINLSEASTFTKILTTNTTFSITGVPASTSAVFTLVITNGGNYVVSWPSNMKWASGEVPTLTSNGVDILTFITVDGGTTWFGTPSILDASS